MWLVVECGVCRLQHVLLCFVCFSRSVTLLLLVFVALSGRFSGIAGPFTRGDGEDACVLFVSCFVSFLLGKNVCVLSESCSSSRSFLGKTSASCLSHAPCPVRLGEKKKLTAEFREDIPRKDVCYVDERALFRVRVYRVDFTEPTCARLMWFGICVVGIS